MTLTNLFQIDGKSLYAPDCDIEPSYSDLDSSDSGRDEVHHRAVCRQGNVSVHPSQSRLFHRDRNHHLLLQQIRHRLAQRQDETVEEP